jgi:hypothetical protein
MKSIHDFLPYAISIIAIWSGIYMLTRYKRLRRDKVLRMNFISLAVAILYVGIIYSLYSFGLFPATSLNILLRPVNLLLVLIPSLIAWRMSP